MLPPPNVHHFRARLHELADVLLHSVLTKENLRCVHPNSLQAIHGGEVLHEKVERDWPADVMFNLT
jgi:phosphopantothenoylcysteine synthetase/decarboxylase